MLDFIFNDAEGKPDRHSEDTLCRSPATIVTLRSETLRLYFSICLPSDAHLTPVHIQGQTHLLPLSDKDRRASGKVRRLAGVSLIRTRCASQLPRFFILERVVDFAHDTVQVDRFFNALEASCQNTLRV